MISPNFTFNSLDTRTDRVRSTEDTNPFPLEQYFTAERIE